MKYWYLATFLFITYILYIVGFVSSVPFVFTLAFTLASIFVFISTFNFIVLYLILCFPLLGFALRGISKVYLSIYLSITYPEISALSSSLYIIIILG